jgi:2-oxoglutarate ferredoxin oxidoreductase subunit gamma
MTEKIIIAGFGGQGIILAGKLIAHAGMLEGRYVSHIPSYGVEMRGGTANCSVIVSDREVASPLIPHPTTLIVMNQPSLEKFEETVIPGGKIFVNESLIDRKIGRKDVEAYYIPANNIAEESGSGRASNMAMIGAYISVTKVIAKDVVKKSIPEVLSKRNLQLLDVNFRAFDTGHAYIGKLLGV